MFLLHISFDQLYDSLIQKHEKYRSREQVLTFTACIAPMADCWSENTANANGCNHNKKEKCKKMHALG